MALGKIKADTLEHSTAGSLDTSYVVNGSLKGYLNFAGNAGTPSATDSFNQSGITDGGTGIFACAFTSSMSNANYGHTNGGDHSAAGVNTNKYDSRSASTFNCRAYDISGNLNDNAYISLSFQGDLA
tara:strand:+ start:364 stop:744 length:381 start_codon:yes stop_codon:yes gene_type:complete